MMTGEDWECLFSPDDIQAFHERDYGKDRKSKQVSSSGIRSNGENYGSHVGSYTAKELPCSSFLPSQALNFSWLVV